MVRNLYRSYLYAVCIILLIVATTTTSVSLGRLLDLTLLRGPYSSALDYRSFVQVMVAFITVWIVTLLLGGLHYWLIRRDMADDPAGGGGTVRSLFLNVTQFIAAPIAVAEGAVGIGSLGQSYYNASSIAVALSVGGLWALLQWERSRTPVRTNAARALQRLHLYGAQLALVFIATPFWLQAANTSTLKALAHQGLYNPCLYTGYEYGAVPCAPDSYYSLRMLAAQWGAALLVAACWVGYTIYSDADRHSRLRQVTHLLAFGYALGFILWSVQRIVGSMLLAAIGQPLLTPDFGPGAATTAGALFFGVVTLAAYWWLYARESPGLPSGVPAAGLALEALAALIFAYPFWLGAQTLLHDVVERVVPAGAHPDRFAFALAGSQTLTGAAFIVLLLHLDARTRRTGVTWPHRVFTLILLASGVIMSAVGLIVALQSFISAWLGAASGNWQQTARSGLVTLLAGGVMVAIFLTIAARNRYLVTKQEAKPLPEPPLSTETQPIEAAAPGMPATLEGILDDLLAGRLSRDEAAAQIRAREGVR